MAANDTQVAGTHYKALKPEPWDVIIAWQLGYLDGCAVKYLARWRTKYSDPKKRLDDLKKAMHYVEKCIEVEEAKLEAEKPVIVGGIHPVEYTAAEGCAWVPVREKVDLANDWEQLVVRRRTWADFPLKDGWIFKAHAIKFSNGRIWDMINGWRDESVKKT